MAAAPATIILSFPPNFSRCFEHFLLASFPMLSAFYSPIAFLSMPAFPVSPPVSNLF
jgi:hypothetical protein